MVRFPRMSGICGLLVLCSVSLLGAKASTFSTTGNFAADNSDYELTFSVTGTTDFTAATTSFATGGFVPVLTLFNGTTGSEIDNNGTGFSDVSLSDVLGTGTYDLFLTEFPNVALGDLATGFLFAGDPTATGDLCGVAGGMFLNTSMAPCTATSSAYALTTTTNAASSVTPEPPSALLLLLPLAGAVALNRRKLA